MDLPFYREYELPWTTGKEQEKKFQRLLGIIVLIFVALLFHAWVGVRDVLMDYVSPIAIRASLLTLVSLTLLACGLWAAQILILARLA